MSATFKKGNSLSIDTTQTLKSKKHGAVEDL